MADQAWKKKAAGLLKNKYALCVLLLGAVLMLLPRCSGGKSEPEAEAAEAIAAPAFSVTEQEEKLSRAVSSIQGAGETRVVLALKGGVERELAQENGEAVIVSAGSGTQAPVELRYVYPEYLGALVICSGAKDPSVRLAVTQAVSAVTGLGSDRITVVQMSG